MYAHQQLAYAPTPYSYTPAQSLSITINPDEVRAQQHMNLFPHYVDSLKFRS